MVPLPYYIKHCGIISKPMVNSNWSYSPETLNLDQNRWFFQLCDLAIWRMTLKNNRVPLLCYFKLCASFRSHWWIQTGVTVRKRSIWVQLDDFLSRVTLRFDRWPWKIIGHLFYATSSFVHHFVAIDGFNLELQSGNAQSGSNFRLDRQKFTLALWPLQSELKSRQKHHSSPDPLLIYCQLVSLKITSQCIYDNSDLVIIHEKASEYTLFKIDNSIFFSKWIR